MAMTHTVEPGFVVEPSSVHDKRFTTPFSDGVSHVTGRQVAGVAASIHPDFAQNVIEFETQKDSPRNLNDLHQERMEVNSRHTWRKTSTRPEFRGIYRIGGIRNRAGAIGRPTGLELLLSPSCQRRHLSGKRRSCRLKSLGILSVPNTA